MQEPRQRIYMNKEKIKTAIALEYNPDEDAPKVIASGKGLGDKK